MPKPLIRATCISTYSEQITFKAPGYSSFTVPLPDEGTRLQILNAGGIQGWSNEYGLHFDRDFNGHVFPLFVVGTNSLYLARRSSYPTSVTARFVNAKYHSHHKRGYDMYEATFEIRVNHQKHIQKTLVPGARLSELEWRPNLSGVIDAAGEATFTFQDYPQDNFTIKL